MALPKRVTEEKSEPRPVSDEWSTHEKNTCPTSTHRKKVHVGKATTRITVTTTWSNGQKTRSYIDHCTCKFCGKVWEQEWMPA